MHEKRRSGVLLHPTSLPGKYGIGELGPEALHFADVLAEMGQRIWQVLPLGPTSYGDSPYQSPSSFAGNPLIISFDQLVADGFLEDGDLAAFPEFTADTIDYGTLIPARLAVLSKASANFKECASEETRADFDAFCGREAYWLDDYTLFMSIKWANGGGAWTGWPEPLRRREPSALESTRAEYVEDILREKILQYLFDRQWTQLRERCRAHGIDLLGDVPIFVAHDSADVWANPELFYLNEDGSLTFQSGVPPDYFSRTGQLWGNPLYRWPAHANSGFAWWVARMRKALELVDSVRIDHFRGMIACWRVPGDATTAEHGHWARAKGRPLLEALQRELGSLPLIAEDLGVITPAVIRLRDDFGLPGMRILQFAFGDDPQASDFRPENYPPNCVVYTGTHDNDTTVGWFRGDADGDSTRSEEDIRKEHKAILAYFGSDGSEIHWDMIACALRSSADTAIVPLQDMLGLDSSARLNVPGRASGNWGWRFRWEMLTPETISRMRQLTAEGGRT